MRGPGQEGWDGYRQVCEDRGVGGRRGEGSVSGHRSLRAPAPPHTFLCRRGVNRPQKRKAENREGLRRSHYLTMGRESRRGQRGPEATVGGARLGPRENLREEMGNSLHQGPRPQLGPATSEMPASGSRFPREEGHGAAFGEPGRPARRSQGPRVTAGAATPSFMTSGPDEAGQAGGGQDSTELKTGLVC
uniref:Uncharacterized protein n=1 Tax=Molossus molossus TaxID=27622 RepID=A0A7J8HC48_MOLMO|nr:hypothetical protein HJG59_011095 [Molossus molossus]